MSTATGTYATLAPVKARLGITNTNDDTLLSSFCDQINQYIEGPRGAGRVLAPVASAVHLFDGDGSRHLWVPQGVRAVTLVRVAAYTGAAWETIPSADILLRPLVHDRAAPNWPATHLLWTDMPSSTDPYSAFPCGLSNVEVTMTTGWSAIPDDITQLALTAVVRAWTARMAGQADVIGTDEYGKPIVSWTLPSRDERLLRSFAEPGPQF